MTNTLVMAPYDQHVGERRITTSPHDQHVGTGERRITTSPDMQSMHH